MKNLYLTQVSEHTLSTLSHEQLKNLVRDIRDSNSGEIDLQAALAEEKTLHLSLDDTTAEKIGLKIAADFGLKKSREHKGRFVTDAGTYKPMGIARRAIRHIEEGIRGEK
jgi:hypothetical protein